MTIDFDQILRNTRLVEHFSADSVNDIAKALTTERFKQGDIDPLRILVPVLVRESGLFGQADPEGGA